MTLINWNEPIETVDGEPCEVVETLRNGAMYVRILAEHRVDQRVFPARNCWAFTPAGSFVNPDGRHPVPRIRNVSKPTAREPQAVQVGDRVTISAVVAKIDTVFDTRNILVEVGGSDYTARWLINRADIHSIEPRPLKVGDKVRIKGEPPELIGDCEIEYLCRESGRAIVFIIDGGRSALKQVSELERIA
jgi:hypothetical protein